MKRVLVSVVGLIFAALALSGCSMIPKTIQVPGNANASCTVTIPGSH